MSTYKARASDHRVAEQIQAEQELMCTAQGCPHRWSVDAGRGRLCSWHAWSDPRQWPRITQERLDALAERAARDQSREPVASKVLSWADKTEILKRLRAALKPRRGNREWARRIVERARSGERVSPLVLKMARAVAFRTAAVGDDE